MGARIAAGLVGLALVLPVLIYGGPLGVWWLMLPFLVIALDEYVRMALPHLTLPGRALYHLGGLGLVAVAVFAPRQLLLALPALVMLCLSLPMFARAQVEQGARDAVHLGFGYAYVPMMMAPLALLRQEPDGLGLIFFLLASTWLGDTGAYFAGRAFGKTPLFPRVSPKKTVEGVVGGLLLAVAGAGGFKWLLGVQLSWPVALGAAAVLDVAGVVGDLSESMLKRAFGVKDSGTIMPGHGGILDRIDSLLFTAPLLWVIVEGRAAFLP
jgi:phosphatidate cytidylyltransferase